LIFWLRKVTTHRAIDQLRQRSRIELSPLDDDAQPVSPADGGDPLLQRHLRLLLLDMSPSARAVLLLRYQEDLDPIDIARTLDMPINTVNNQAIGLALIASEPRQFTIVNIVGAIDLEKLHKLEGRFGVPKLDVELPKTPIPNPQK
jgi:hypothetical protein